MFRFRNQEDLELDIEQLKETLKVDEGVVYEIYNDHLGYATFGIGHLVLEGEPEHGLPVGTPVSEDRVNECFEKDIMVSNGQEFIFKPRPKNLRSFWVACLPPHSIEQ